MILKENYADSVPCRTLNVQLFQPVFFPESVRHVSGMGVRFHRNMHIGFFMEYEAFFVFSDGSNHSNHQND